MIKVQEDEFNAGNEINSFLSANANSGGIASFVGQVRDFHGERDNPTTAVSMLELEYYPGMTERELARLESEARARWPLDDVLVIHRYGTMSPGAVIVLVCTASAHREDAFASCEFLMDQLKTNAPFWKRENTDSGVSWVAARDTDEARSERWASTNSQTDD